MTLGGRLIAWFPTLVLVLAGAAGIRFCLEPGVVSLSWVILVIYGFPVLCFRLHNRLWPLEEGLSQLDEPVYSPWWGAHQIQVIYDAVPFLEALLRVIPGAYSAWLRLWGSRIGRGVVWTPRVEITDRSLLEIGDGAIFGHKVACYGHVVAYKCNRLMLYVKRIQIGKQVFLGAGSRLGPGASVADGTRVPLLSDIAVDQKVDRGLD